ncbi:hypothetical protein BDQ12DRAFT_651626 [Crucibulum laeve]|uniref:Heterokaryon incompatibility domain-containing protein n=1 Tax=Crucibulum laeve TaxID=68775 RepID=A0A5C3MBM1_9AGAR|nr:hypothetical protein BDQ12DRAFT_651626 [Crucibulum laeve]
MDITSVIFYIFLAILRVSTILALVYAGTKTLEIQASFRILRERLHLRRLLEEDEGVEGPSWFSRERSHQFHQLANVLRCTFHILFSPLSLIPSHVFQLSQHILQPRRASQPVELFGSVLAKSPSNGSLAEYQNVSFHPRWLLKVEFRLNTSPQYEQVSWSDDVRAAGYTALSYPLKSAFKLFRDAGRTLQDPSPFSKGRRWSLRDRQRIAEQVLIEYGLAKGRTTQIETEYIWLDELCLSSKTELEMDAIQEQRTMELGRMADIFGGAAKVCIFCHERDCDHTGPNCPWGTRLFSLAEIIHAAKIVRMTRPSSKRSGTAYSQLFAEPGKVFRRNIQNRAEAEKQWHLQAIMQYANGAGFASHDAIHALVVELIRRDEANDFRQHNLLGKSLNALLPRRARLADLPGKDGWVDLVFLLELNQAFYNVATLAAVCSLQGSDADTDDNAAGDTDSLVLDFPVRHTWLGKPILPAPGIERLKPLVTAFPAVNAEGGGSNPALNIVSSQIIPIHHILRRDTNAFYHSTNMSGLRILCFTSLLAILWLDIDFILPHNSRTALLVLWVASALAVTVKLAVGTLYLQRDGWMILEGTRSDKDLEEYLTSRDFSFQNLYRWGDPSKHTIPQWHAATDSRAVMLVDLKSTFFVRVNAIGRPNVLIPLAIHGSGITCMLLHKSATSTARVGMANVPPHILNENFAMESIYIGGGPCDEDHVPQSNFLLRAFKLMTDVDIYSSKSTTENIVTGSSLKSDITGSLASARSIVKTVHFAEEESHSKEDADVVK